MSHIPAGVFETNSINWQKFYEQRLGEHHRRHRATSSDSNILWVYAVIPLLETCLGFLKFMYQSNMGQFTKVIKRDETYWEGLESSRSRLRRQIHEFKQCATEYSKYLLAQAIQDPDLYEPYVQIKEEAQAVLDNASELEAEIRDWLQLQVGNLAVLESRKSIQLSNLQMEESKRRKHHVDGSYCSYVLIDCYDQSQDWYCHPDRLFRKAN